MPKISSRTVYSVGIFLILSLAAIGLIVAAVYFVSQRGEQARRDNANEVAIQMQDQREQSERPDKVTTGTDATSSADNDTSTEGAAPVTDEETDAQPVNELPATGTELNNLVAVSLLSLSFALYIGSRHSRRSNKL